MPVRKHATAVLVLLWDRPTLFPPRQLPRHPWAVTVRILLQKPKKQEKDHPVKSSL